MALLRTLRAPFLSRVATVIGILLLAACAPSVRPGGLPPPPASPGRVSGHVRDPSGAPLAGAIVSLISRRLGQDLMAVTDADGAFEFPAVPPSRDWRLHAEDSAFQAPEDRHVVVKAGIGLALDMRMARLPELRRFRRDAAGRIVHGRNAPEVPGSWQEISGDDLFTFCLPPEFSEVGGRGQDPWVKDFEGPGLYVAFRFGYTFGPYSCEDMARCRERLVAVGGRAAQLLTYEDPKPPDEAQIFRGRIRSGHGQRRCHLLLLGLLQRPGRNEDRRADHPEHPFPLRWGRPAHLWESRRGRAGGSLPGAGSRLVWR